MPNVDILAPSVYHQVQEGTDMAHAHDCIAQTHEKQQRPAYRAKRPGLATSHTSRQTLGGTSTARGKPVATIPPTAVKP